MIYGYATGVLSSRKLERETYDSVAFRYISGNQHPDHDTLSTFRSRFKEAIEKLFVQVLEIAHSNKLSQFGTLCLDSSMPMPASTVRYPMSMHRNCWSR